MTCTRPQAENQKSLLTRGRRPHMTQSGHLMHPRNLRACAMGAMVPSETFDEKIEKDAHLRQATTPGQI